ncbi:MAG: GNAT family N-acetyltransferase [Opitutaceae bacterium]
MPTPGASPVVVHAPESRRFEIRLGEALAVAEYVRGEGEIVLTRTFVPPELRGRGLAERLVRAALEFARTERLRVVPACSYVAVFVERHPDLVAPSG